MPSFSQASLKQLETCDVRLQLLLHEAIQFFNFTILEGHRNEARQNQAYISGKSKVKWPNGRHNSIPSLAVDIAPFPIDWSSDSKAIERFVYLAGYIMCLAELRGITLRWGGDWNRDDDTRDERFRDYGHFEIL